MSLNVANWADKQLDELADLLQTGDFSSIAAFVCQNFLAQGSRVLYGGTVEGTLQNIELTVTINSDAKAVDISKGVFLHNNKISQLDSSQSVNILDTSSGTWGTGKVANATKNRWSIICVKNAEQANTPEDRWFVDDSVDPNTYSQIQTNTLINKAYYEIVVVHGDDVAGITYAASNPVVPSGYFVIAEIYVPAAATEVLIANVYDTTDTSNATNWTSYTRVPRLEFWSYLFGVDHDTTNGYHRESNWHIGSTKILTTGAELNRLNGISSNVTAANLNILTGSGATTLHSHGTFTTVSPVTLISTTGFRNWEDLDVSAYVPASAKFAYISAWLNGQCTINQVNRLFLEFRKRGTGYTGFQNAFLCGTSRYTYIPGTFWYQVDTVDVAGVFFVELDNTRMFQYFVSASQSSYTPSGFDNGVTFAIILLGYI
jgi:hypothetical protein